VPAQVFNRNSFIPPYIPIMPDHNIPSEDKAYLIGNFFDYGDDFNRILEDNPVP